MIAKLMKRVVLKSEDVRGAGDSSGGGDEQERNTHGSGEGKYGSSVGFKELLKGQVTAPIRALRESLERFYGGFHPGNWVAAARNAIANRYYGFLSVGFEVEAPRPGGFGSYGNTSWMERGL